MQYVLFLDLDGVMHPTGSCIWDEQAQQMKADGAFRWWPILEDILQGIGVPVDIVIHSTWRFMWEHDDELLAVLPPTMRPYVVGATNRNCMGRESSIVDYVANNPVSHYLVLDDEPGAFAKGYEPLVVCASDTGLSDVIAANKLRERMGQWPVLQYIHEVP